MHGGFVNREEALDSRLFGKAGTDRLKSENSGIDEWEGGSRLDLHVVGVV
jgi:hypothetical protein